MSVARVLQVAIPFLWLGAVLGISFLEAPLKFRAPGVTLELGLGIGRLVFRALNVVEVVLGVVLAAAVLAGAPPGGWTGTDSGTLTVVALWCLLAVLVCQIAVVRPRLERRTRRVLAGDQGPRSRSHLGYVALEVVKVVLLPSLGVLLIVGGVG